MIPNLLVTELSRWQFAFTAIFHFLFVPLTLGLTWLLVIMEAAYFKTGKIIYKDMTQFWGKLLAINFAIGVISGIALEFEFGLNWAYFSRIAGGTFGTMLAIEGITAFMLEATMFGLFFFTWDKLSRTGHFIVTILLAIGTSLSIVNILSANTWMQDPIATHFNYHNMTLELQSLSALYINTYAQIRIGHTAFASFIVSAIFVMGISSYYLRQHRDIQFAKSSFAAAAAFGLICGVMTLFFGDQNGLELAKHQPEKMAAIEGQWETQKPPAAWYLIAFPNQEKQKNYFTVSIPYALSLVATHSLSGTVEGMKSIIKRNEKRIKNGINAYHALQDLQKNDRSKEALKKFKQYQNDLGFGYLLIPFSKDFSQVTSIQINNAARYGIPHVSIPFWSFRIMLIIWVILMILMTMGVIFSLRGTLQNHRLFLRCCIYAIPLPFIAAESGWILTETGRQPWLIYHFMPTFMGTSSLDIISLIISLILFVLFYSVLFGIELFLMFKFAKKGAGSLGTGRYHGEKHA